MARLGGTDAWLSLRAGGAASPVNDGSDDAERNAKDDDTCPAVMRHQPAADRHADGASGEGGGHIEAVDAALCFRIDGKSASLVRYQARLHAYIKHDDPNHEEYD